MVSFSSMQESAPVDATAAAVAEEEAILATMQSQAPLKSVREIAEDRTYTEAMDTGCARGLACAAACVAVTLAAVRVRGPVGRRRGGSSTCRPKRSRKYERSTTSCWYAAPREVVAARLYVVVVARAA